MNIKAKFEIGKTYITRSICDSDCVITGKVVRRTAQTVTMIMRDGQTKTLRVVKGLSDFIGAEAVKPWGTFSMAPTLSAERVLVA